MGVIMLSAISYVALSTGERPFYAINTRLSPALGWAWALATLAANIVWSMPQFSLAVGVLQQNLLPDHLGETSQLGDLNGKLLVTVVILAVTITIVWLYDSGGWGIKLFDWILKAMVGVVVICFFGVAIKLAAVGSLNWGELFAGFIPDFSRASVPATTFGDALAAIAEPYRTYWSDAIVAKQRDVMITAVATAVGINMTFLLPYSMLSRGWDKTFRGLAIFDLSTGMAIPYFVATSCVVIASASQFHGRVGSGLAGAEGEASKTLSKEFNGELAKRATWAINNNEEFADLRDSLAAWNAMDAESKEANPDANPLTAVIDQIPQPEQRLAAMIANRDTGDLSAALKPLAGGRIADVAFGIGVLGMGISTIIILMLISGFVICEMLGLPQGGWPHRIACLAPAVGVLGPFYWTKAAAYLAVPTSVFGMALLPIAYVTFFLLMNNKGLLGENMPTGGRRLLWNVLMGISCAGAIFGAGWVIASKIGWQYGAILLVVALLLIGGTWRGGRPAPAVDRSDDHLHDD